MAITKQIKPARTKFYTYYQNNSGGSFDYDEKIGVGHIVIVEAPSAEDANQLAKNREMCLLCSAGCGCCKCCGPRWSQAEEGDGTAEPMIEGEPVGDYRYRLGIGVLGHTYHAFVHYANGRTVAYSAE